MQVFKRVMNIIKLVLFWLLCAVATVEVCHTLYLISEWIYLYLF